ncbi:Guanine nucleotide binding protein (G protein), beta polypeptide 1-like [Gonapodya sp. JEL0774]|nr:Guanine nucleotide binding protein (G protein), beta polypeptide 1-like [Gonapodya sp. JEL0774]
MDILSVMYRSELEEDARDNAVEELKVDPYSISSNRNGPRSDSEPKCEKEYPANGVSFCKMSVVTLKTDNGRGLSHLAALPTLSSGNACDIVHLESGRVLVSGIGFVKRHFGADPESSTNQDGMLMCVRLVPSPLALCTEQSGGTGPFPPLHLCAGYESGVVVVRRVLPVPLQNGSQPTLETAQAQVETVWRHKFFAEPVLALDITPTLLAGICASAAPEDKVWTWSLVSEVNSLTPLHTSCSPLNNQSPVDPKISYSFRPGVAHLAIRPDHRLAAFACWDGKVRVFGVAPAKGSEGVPGGDLRLKLLAVLRYHMEGVGCLAFVGKSGLGQWGDGGNSLLASGAKDGRIAVWKIY